MNEVQRLARLFSERGKQGPAARWGRMFLLSALVGVLAGTAAAGLEYALELGLHHAIGRFTHVAGPGVLDFNWGILLLPAFGGLAAGALVHWLCRQEHLHGTNQLVTAFHHKGGDLPVPDPAIKAAAAVGLISAGGSAGPEGPIAALGAAIGSSVARLLGLSPRMRRIMLVAGCGGGVGAIFQCPLGGAMFATSVLYREPEFEADGIVPAFVASILSYSVFMGLMAFGHEAPYEHYLIHGATALRFDSALELVPYAMLGVLCGVLAIVLGAWVRFIEGPVLRRLPVPRWLSAGLAGLLVGAMGCLLPQIMDAQYEFIQKAVSGFGDGPMTMHRSWWGWAAVFGCVAVGKCVACGLTVGATGAGGLLGPSVFIGGAAGAFLGALLEALYPGSFPEDLRRSLIAVGTAGVLAGAMRTPLAAIVMVTEMTGSYGLIVPLMLVCITAYVVGRRWGLNTAQVQSASESPAHAGDALVHLLQAWRVRDLMEKRWPFVVTPYTTLGEMVGRVPSGSRPVFAVVESGRLVGVISLSDISRVMSEPGMSDLVIAADMMTTQIRTVDPDQPLYEVLSTFRTVTHNLLPVVSEGSQRFLGVLTRQAIHQAVRQHSEQMRAHLHREHSGIATIEQDEQLYHIVVGVSAPSPDTIQRIAVPFEAVGKSIREADFRRQFGAQIIGVQNPDGTMQCPPDINAPLRPDQMLLAILPEATSPQPPHASQPQA